MNGSVILVAVMLFSLAVSVLLPIQPPRLALEAFTYKDVIVERGPMAVQARGAREYYLRLNEDSLLQGFRLRAGLPAPGSPMGGWYDPDGFAAAHPFGQYISALARMYANSGDVRFKAKATRLVHGFHLAMGPDGTFFASTKVEREWPCYIYDKMCIAMRDAYSLTGDKEALQVLGKMTDWAYTRLPRRSDEWYTLPENLYKCYELTKDSRYLIMAKEYDYSKDYYNVFARGGNAFTPERHAYSHINSLSSSAKAYEFSGDSKYLAATESAWNFLTTTQMYASGGWGSDEHFVVAGHGKLAESLTISKKNFETPCGAYANTNLDRYLLRFTGETKYGDNMERVLLNGMLASLAPQPDGLSFYYSSYQPGTKKEYFPDKWPCCNGTYAETTADYPLDIYFHSGNRLYVNLFADSSVTWTFGSKVVSIRQSTTFPANPNTQFVIHVKNPTSFSLDIRKPAWCLGGATIELNGTALRVPSQDAGHINIDRIWRNGDSVRITFQRGLRLEPIDAQTQNRVALMFGPLLLVAIANQDVELKGDRSKPGRWIKPVAGTESDFITNKGILFRPLYLIKDEHYTTYCHLE